MTGSPPAASCILGRRTASMSNTQGGSRVPKLGLLGSVRGVRSNAHPYRKQNRPQVAGHDGLLSGRSLVRRALAEVLFRQIHLLKERLVARIALKTLEEQVA